ncbi:ATP-binding protein [Moraxella nasovis]|uniref:ATP-binding protein n=1 Tax=Moraxella nasovis TaxID=2904121 RepID=UPI001F608CDD|nr:ATP-binding protein [Moraxella nasovis]UNU73448.1 ATP-binding protein [Moraxella nasovis]
MNTDFFDEKLKRLLIEFLQNRTTKPSTIDPDVLAYRWVGGKLGHLQAMEVHFTHSLDDLLGIDTQKHKIIANTEQFLAGFPANHVLMTGARGTGKSSIVRALLHRYHKQGLRIIEVAREDLLHLEKIRHTILQHNPYHRYIIYCDDLAFSSQDESYRSLKSVLDGSLGSDQDRLLIYATSNRRHLLPQLMKDNQNIYNGQTDEINPFEQIDETVSLSDRFGLWLSFYSIDQQTYLDIVKNNLNKHHIILTDEAKASALRWASERGGRSGRVAEQFARHYIGQKLLNDSIS